MNYIKFCIKASRITTSDISQDDQYPSPELLLLLLKQTPWPEAASELRNRCLSAKLVPTFANRGCHVVSVTDPLWAYSRISSC
jgi:sirohydrochlorin ferrochelatase